MHIEFTIDRGFIEFICHFVAASCYITAGIMTGKDHGLTTDAEARVCGFMLALAVILQVIGAHL